MPRCPKLIHAGLLGILTHLVLGLPSFAAVYAAAAASSGAETPTPEAAAGAATSQPRDGLLHSRSLVLRSQTAMAGIASLRAAQLLFAAGLLPLPAAYSEVPVLALRV